MNKNIIVALLLATSVSAFAQQLPELSLFQFNKQAFNPAYVGNGGLLNAGIDYRSQWVKTEGAPETFAAGVHGALGKGSRLPHHNAGVFFYTDQVGVTTANTVLLQYAYRLKISNDLRLSFGVQGSYNNTNSNFSSLRSADGADPLTENNNQTNQANLGAGVYLNGDKFYVGAASPFLLETDEDLSGKPMLEQRREYLLMTGYLLEVCKPLKLRANVLARYQPLKQTAEGPTTADFNLSAIFKDFILAGVTYRTDNTVAIIAQAQITRGINIGYGYDVRSGKFGRVGGSSHEIYLGFNLVPSKSAITTPRFVSFF